MGAECEGPRSSDTALRSASTKATWSSTRGTAAAGRGSGSCSTSGPRWLANGLADRTAHVDGKIAACVRDRSVPMPTLRETIAGHCGCHRSARDPAQTCGRHTAHPARQQGTTCSAVASCVMGFTSATWPIRKAMRGAVHLPKSEVPIQRSVSCDKHQRICQPLTRCPTSTASGRAVHTR